jgi:predicted esterase
VILLFFGVLFWAKGQDPFGRKWFILKTTGHSSFDCVAVFPRPLRQSPVVIYAHDSGETLMNDGNGLRQMAELGLVVVSLGYNQTNEAAFASEFGTLLDYVGRQKWADTNAIIWVGFGLGANRMLDFALQHPEQQPQLLIQLNGAGLREVQSDSRVQLLRCPILLVHGEQDEMFPVANTEHLASVLKTNNVPVEIKIINCSHEVDPERGVVFRSIGEYCLAHLGGNNGLKNYHSIAQRQAEALPLWLFCLPAATWIIGWFAWWRHRKSVSSDKIERKRRGVTLRWLAVLLTMWIAAEMTIHLITPYLSISKRTLSIARRFLVQPKERVDFEVLAAQPIWHGERLKLLLEHVELAGYDRSLVNWKLKDEMYQDYVLSPVISGNSQEQLNWRRPLWEEFYPHIRGDSSLKDVAEIVVRHLRERVTIATFSNLSHDVSTIWRKQITDKTGFGIIYVAVLRSVGVPARLDSNQRVEFWNGDSWQIAPSPCIINWLSRPSDRGTGLLDQGERRDPVADDVEFVFAPTGGLPFAPPCGAAGTKLAPS